MANRFPLIVDPIEEKIEELPSGDNLDLTGSDISSVRNILPETTELYNLGSESLKFKDLFLSGNSIFIGNGSISLSNGIFTFTDENDQTLTLSTDGTQFTNVTANTITADFFVGNGSQVDNVDAITLEGSDKDYFENYAETFANSAYANAVTYTDNQITALVNSAPGVLDTLNELASAINDDENFAVTITNQISNAYSNAVSYTDGEISTLYTNVTSYADVGDAETYANATAYADSVAGDAYANAVLYVDTEIGNLVNSAPGVLDTLNELAEAIGDDDNFFVTVNNNINTAYSNAVSEATILANNAFTNAVAYVDEQTTDTIEEGNTNLYYTNSRVRDSLSSAGDLTYDSNTGEFSVTTYKSTDFDTDFSGKTTDELTEGNTNLYYLDSRVDSHLSGANGITYNAGAITADQDISSGANVTFTKVDGLATPTANTDATNKQYVDGVADDAFTNAVSEATSLASNAYSNAVSYVDTEIANLVNTAPTVLDTLNELAEAINDDPDFANSVASQISTAYSNSIAEAISLAANAYANAVAYVDSQTTDTIEEGGNNLYHTEERVRDSLSSSGDLVYDSNTGEFSVVTYKSSDFNTDFSGKSTDDLTEGNTNLYFIEAPNDGEQYVRQNESWVTVDIPEGYDSNNFSTDFASQTTDDLTEGSNNLYFTEERVVDAVENNTVNTVSVESNLIVPVGNTTSRPANSVVGMIRFNTELNVFEGYDGVQWVQLSGTFDFEGDLELLSGSEDLEEGSGTTDLN